jgi:exopolysaccharide production protein ExoQ
MRNAHGAVRARMTRSQRGADRGIGPTIRKAGGSSLVLLVILYWLIIYQNLPDNPLNDVQSAGHVSMVNTDASPGADTGNTAFRIIRIGMIAISVYVIATRWSLVRSLSKTTNPGFIAFMLLAPLSFVWSIAPSVTLLRYTTFACIVLVCYAISLAGWDRQRLQQVTIPPMTCIMVASLLLGIMYPDRIIEIGDDISQHNAWHGISFSKNIFGMMASVTVVLCLHRWLAREGRMLWSVAATAAAFACLVLSRSNTSLFAAMVGIFFMVLVMRVPIIKRRYSTQVVVGIAATLLLYELVIQDVVPGVKVLLAPVTSLTGKDTTFSARTFIWNIIKEHIHAAPYLGTGYAAYWTGPTPDSPSFVFKYLMYFYPTESHNGYLEVVNDLGLVGLACLLLFVFWFIRYALQLMRFDRSQAALYLALLFQEMVMNMSESDWFSRSSSFTTLILASFCLSRGLLEHRLYAQSAGSARR